MNLHTAIGFEEKLAEDWFVISNAGEIPSPALLVYADRLEQNIRRMIEISGKVDRLRPHIKTNKMPGVVRQLLAQGITKLKCATIAEAEMAAECGAPDVLLAYQPVGPNIRRLLDLASAFPKTKFSTIADNAESLRALSEAADGATTRIEVLLDIDCGQHRTGVPPDFGAWELYRLLDSLPALDPGGLHVYDGHINHADLRQRTIECEESFAPAHTLREELLAAHLPVPHVVAGGTPTFAIHARRTDVECSPGTCVFWDFGYGSKFTDLDFHYAALLLTRVISRPAANRLCLDLGHKSVASEMPHPRVHFLSLPDAKAVLHSEEHLVVETERAGDFPVGSVLYGVPWHICPTVNLHSEALLVRDGKVCETWRVTARERKLHI
ncbi:MAG: D-TA family PLP-dependent enzyme [Verrucomicrobiales bacterium]|nr:D-TA family PLP-dependent enzyme [Verrucomicrobiales bacterium]